MAKIIKIGEGDKPDYTGGKGESLVLTKTGKEIWMKDENIPAGVVRMGEPDKKPGKEWAEKAEAKHKAKQAKKSKRKAKPKKAPKKSKRKVSVPYEVGRSKGVSIVRQPSGKIIKKRTDKLTEDTVLLKNRETPEHLMPAVDAMPDAIAGEAFAEPAAPAYDADPPGFNDAPPGFVQTPTGPVSYAIPPSLPQYKETHGPVSDNQTMVPRGNVPTSPRAMQRVPEGSPVYTELPGPAPGGVESVPAPGGIRNTGAPYVLPEPAANISLPPAADATYGTPGVNMSMPADVNAGVPQPATPVPAAAEVPVGSNTPGAVPVGPRSGPLKQTRVDKYSTAGELGGLAGSVPPAPELDLQIPDIAKIREDADPRNSPVFASEEARLQSKLQSDQYFAQEDEKRRALDLQATEDNIRDLQEDVKSYAVDPSYFWNGRKVKTGKLIVDKEALKSGQEEIDKKYDPQLSKAKTDKEKREIRGRRSFELRDLHESSRTEETKEVGGLNFAQKIGLIISAGLASYASALQGGDPMAGMKMLDGFMDRNIQMQKIELGRRQGMVASKVNFLGELRSRFKDERAAEHQAKAAMAGSLATEIARKQTLVSDAVTQTKLDKMKNDALRLSHDQALKAHHAEVEATKAAGSMSTLNLAAEKAMRDAKEAGLSREPVGTKRRDATRVFTKEAQKKAPGILSGGKFLTDSINGAMEYFEKSGGNWSDLGVSAKGKTIVGNLILALKGPDWLNLGAALTGYELAVLYMIVPEALSGLPLVAQQAAEKALKKAGSIFDSSNNISESGLVSVMEKLKSLKRTVADRTNSKLKYYNLDWSSPREDFTSPKYRGGFSKDYYVTGSKKPNRVAGKRTMNDLRVK